MGYYGEKLSGTRLRRCYEIAPPRIRQYLEAEIAHLLERVTPADTVLELGCGYGRVAFRLARRAKKVVGIDNAPENLELAAAMKGTVSNCEFIGMDALATGFPDGAFDVVACVQNGICAFGVDRELLVREALRVTRPGGLAIFSSYSDRVWDERLRWFELQAEEGLVGEIDRERTGGGTIVCRDGFRAGSLGEEGFAGLCGPIGCRFEIGLVDDSSVFCELTRHAK